MKPTQAVRALLVPVLPEIPRIVLVCLAGEAVPGVGLAESFDFAPGVRMYRRFHRPRPGTVDGFRANTVATALVRGADPEAGLVFERVVIVGRREDGSLIDVPFLVVRRARVLWRCLPHPRRTGCTRDASLDLRSLNPLLKSS